MPGIYAVQCDGIDDRTGARVPGGRRTLALPAEWGVTTSEVILPPCACASRGGSATVEVIIWHLHDMHRWSREAVAEWIGTVEDSIQERAEKYRAWLAAVEAAVAQQEEKKSPVPISG